MAITTVTVVLPYNCDIMYRMDLQTILKDFVDEVESIKSLYYICFKSSCISTICYRLGIL